MNQLRGDSVNNYRRVFLYALAIGAAAFLPYVIYDGGLFLYYGDFNVQQIPFYMHAHEMVRSGAFGWDWLTDLGSNFIGSYSFYLLFSPFFWLTIPFPTAWLPYLMAPLLVLKSGCAALTGYAYISRFMRDKQTAVFASLLYAFSGFAVYNIFFNHFHEAIIFFPLLLIGLEEAVTERRFGRFALAIALNAVVNYWFFIGEAIFVAIYFFVRLGSAPKWRMTARKFFTVALEVVLGMGLAMFAFLPSVLAIMGNPRTGADSIISGMSLWYYSNPQRYLGIIQSIFFCPDMPALNNMFPDHGAQWASLAAYLPVFGAAGSIAFFRSRRGSKSWLRRMLTISFVMALVPLGNHLFVLLNNSYYTRWFYMPVLLMCLATGLALERTLADPKERSLDYGLRFSGIVIGLLIIISGLTPSVVKDKTEFGIYKYVYVFLGVSVITVLGFGAAVLWAKKLRRSPRAARQLYSIIMLGCFLFTFGCMLIGKISYPDNQWIKQTALPQRGEMSMSEPGVYERCDIYEGNDNLGMYWALPNIQCFHSIIPVSIMQFYPDVGVKRDVSSKPETTLYALRSLLSVRWLYISEDNEIQHPMNGFTFAEARGGYNIYENDNYIPMGFSYDYYMDSTDWGNISEDLRSRAMIRAVYLDDEAVERNADILENIDQDWRSHLTYADLALEADLRRGMVCDSFTVNNSGFVAEASFDTERLIFFSVPWDKGWSAEINGAQATIERANEGFMAVRAPAGDAEIVFTYRTPGLAAGAAVTAASLLIFLSAALFFRRRNRALPQQLEPSVDLDIPARRPEPPRQADASSIPPDRAYLIEQGSPADETAPLGESAPIGESTPADETAPAGGSAPIEEVAPLGEVAPADETAPPEQAPPENSDKP